MAIGGVAGTAAAELYDGTKWTAVGMITMPRMNWCRAVTLKDGSVLVVGADTSIGGTTDKTYVFTYDTPSGTWSTGKTGPAHVNGGFAHLDDDSVVLASGFGITWSVTADRYSAATNTWVPAGSTTTKRNNGTLVKVPGGAVFVGGMNGTAPTNATEFYNEVTNSWTELAPMAKGRTSTNAAYLPSGYVVAAGGGTSSIELFDLKLGKWYSVDSLPKPRTHSASTVLADGSLFIIAGQTNPEGDISWSTPVATTVKYRQSTLGESCTITPDCATGTCTGGVCTAATDAGPTDTGAPPPDTGTLTDTGTPSTDTETTPADTGAPSTDTGVATDSGSATGDTGTLTDTGEDTAAEEDSGKVGGTAFKCPDSTDEEAIKNLSQDQYSQCFGPALTFDAKACSTTPGASSGLGAWALILGLVAARRRRG